MDDIKIKKESLESSQQKESGRERSDVFKNMTVLSSDVGKSFYQLFKSAEDSIDSLTNLSQRESDMLDDLLFRGYVKHTIFIRNNNFPVTFRSVSYKALNNALSLQASEKVMRSQSERASILVALYLEQYGESNEEGHLHFSHSALDRSDFESIKYIKDRVSFVCDNLSSVIVEAIHYRLMEFIEVLQSVSRKENILNF